MDLPLKILAEFLSSLFKNDTLISDKNHCEKGASPDRLASIYYFAVWELTLVTHGNQARYH